MTTANIYSLTNPLTGVVFYVGCTIRKLSERLNGPYGAPTVSELRSKGIQPKIELIESCDVAIGKDMESYWIWQFKAWGFPLENKVYWSGFKNDIVLSRLIKSLTTIAATLSDDDVIRLSKLLHCHIDTVKRYLKGDFNRRTGLANKIEKCLMMDFLGYSVEDYYKSIYPVGWKWFVKEHYKEQRKIQRRKEKQLQQQSA